MLIPPVPIRLVLGNTHLKCTVVPISADAIDATTIQCLPDHLPLVSGILSGEVTA